MSLELSPELSAALTKQREASEEISRALGRLSDTPNTDPQVMRGIADQSSGVPQSGIGPIALSDRRVIRRQLREINKGDYGEAMIWDMFAEQAVKKDVGVPLHQWLNAGGYSTQAAFEGINRQVTPDVSKAIDTGGAAALIRQDLEPFLYELYVRNFPAYDRIRKEPANGLVHAWNQITGFGDAQFMAELGTVTDDQAAYNRATSNVAILATRRGVSLKSQFAVIQGGAGYNPEMLELQGGLRAVAHKMQLQIFSGTSSDSGGQSSNESGAYDANAFDGLRYLLRNNAGNQNVDPATNPTTTGAMRNAMNAAVVAINQTGGRASIIWGHPSDKILFDQQQDPNVRYMESQGLVNVAPGVVTNAVNTVQGPVPFAIVPGDAIGTYNYTGSGFTTARDLYILDEQALTIPFLGTEGPTVLDIPIGIAGQLTHLFVIFLMAGLAPKAPNWLEKVRVKQS